MDFSERLVHPLVWSRVFTATRVFSHLYVFRVYNDHSNNFTDSIFIGEVFQIEVSDVFDLVHPLEIMKKSGS